MRIAPFAPGDLFAFTPQAAQAAHFGWMSREIAEAAAAHVAFSLYEETGGMIGCAGLAPIESDDGEELVAWAVFSARIADNALAVMRACARCLDLFSGRRIVAHVAPDHPKAARFAEALGFRFVRDDADLHPSGKSLRVYVRE